MLKRQHRVIAQCDDNSSLVDIMLLLLVLLLSLNSICSALEPNRILEHLIPHGSVVADLTSNSMATSSLPLIKSLQMWNNLEQVPLSMQPKLGTHLYILIPGQEMKALAKDKLRHLAMSYKSITIIVWNRFNHEFQAHDLPFFKTIVITPLTLSKVKVLVKCPAEDNYRQTFAWNLGSKSAPALDPCRKSRLSVATLTLQVVDNSPIHVDLFETLAHTLGFKLVKEDAVSYRFLPSKVIVQRHA